MERAYTDAVAQIVVKRINLKRRALWGLGTVIGSGAITFLTYIAWAGVVWGNRPDNLLREAGQSAVNVMVMTGPLAFVFVGLSFGRWLSQKYEKPEAPQFEATEYPRLPLESR